MDSVFIDDGMTRKGAVKAVAGLHGRLAFTFRPALAEERYAFLSAGGDHEEGAAYAGRVTELLSKHVTSWDARRGSNATVPVTPEQCRRLHPNVLNQMLDQVLGYAASEQAEQEKN